MSDNELDFDPKRRLCPDGSCVGVMKSDGTCSVCGRDASGVATASAEEPEALAADDGDGGGGGDANTVQSSGAEGFNPSRRLCDDGSCVGVIGADGRCGVCGQQAA